VVGGRRLGAYIAAPAPFSLLQSVAALDGPGATEGERAGPWGSLTAAERGDAELAFTVVMGAERDGVKLNLPVGHPSPVPLQRYAERHIAVRESPRCGAAFWRSDRPSVVRCHREDGRRYWHHVAP
jgi:hypothetical protein